VSEASAVTYAVNNLRVREIVVCGHSNCGAMRAALKEGGPDDPNLAAWLALTDPLKERLAAQSNADASLAAHDQLSQWNALQQLEHLKTYPAVQRALDEGAIRLHAMWFDIARARVLVYSRSEDRFVRVEDTLVRESAA
jgi:carbonic anhydrase